MQIEEEDSSITRYQDKKQPLYNLGEKTLKNQEIVTKRVLLEISELLKKKEEKNFLKNNSIELIRILKNPVIFYEGRILEEILWKNLFNFLLDKILIENECIITKIKILDSLKNINFTKCDFSYIKISEKNLLENLKEKKEVNNFKIQKIKSFKKHLLIFFSILKYRFQNQNFFYDILKLNMSLKKKLLILRCIFHIGKLKKTQFEILENFLNKYRYEELLTDVVFLAKFFKNENFNNFDKNLFSFLDFNFHNKFSSHGRKSGQMKKKRYFREKWIFEILLNILKKKDKILQKKAFDYYIILKNSLRNSSSNNKSPLKNYENFSQILFAFLKKIINDKNQFYFENKKKIDNYIFNYFLLLMLSNNYNVKRLISLIYLIEEKFKVIFADFLEKKISMILKIEKISNRMILNFIERILWIFVKYEKNEIILKLENMAIKLSIKDKGYLESQIEKVFRIIALARIEKKNDFDYKKNICKNLINRFIDNSWIFFCEGRFIFTDQKKIFFSEEEILEFVTKLKNIGLKNNKFFDIENNDFIKRTNFLKSILKIIFNKNEKLILPILEKVFNFKISNFFEKLNFSNPITKILIKIILQIKPNGDYILKLTNFFYKLTNNLLKENNQNYFPLCLYIMKKIVHYGQKLNEISNFISENCENLIKKINESLKLNDLNLKENLALLNMFVFTPDFSYLDITNKKKIISSTFLINQKIFENLRSKSENFGYFTKILNLITSIGLYYENIENHFKFIFDISKTIKYLKFHRLALKDDNFRSFIYKRILKNTFKTYKKNLYVNLEYYLEIGKEVYSDWCFYCISELKSQQINFMKNILNGFNNGMVKKKNFFLIYNKIISDLSDFIIDKNDNESNEVIVPINQFLINMSKMDNNLNKDYFLLMNIFWKRILEKNINMVFKISIVLRVLKSIIDTDCDFLNFEIFKNCGNSFLSFLYYIFMIFNYQNDKEKIKEIFIDFLEKNKNSIFSNISLKLILSIYLIFLTGYKVKNIFEDIEIDFSQKYFSYSDLLKKNKISKNDKIIIKSRNDNFKLKKKIKKGIEIDLDMEMIKNLIEYIRIDLQEKNKKTENQIIIENLLNGNMINLKMIYTLNNNIILNLLLQISNEKTLNKIFDYLKKIFETRDEKWNHLNSMIFFQILHLRLSNLLNEKFDDLLFIYINFLKREFKIKHFLAFFEIQKSNNTIGFISPSLIKKLITKFVNINTNKEKILSLYFYEFANSFFIEKKEILENFHKNLIERKFSTPNSQIYFICNLKRILKNYCFGPMPIENYLKNGTNRNPDINLLNLLIILEKINITNSNYEYFLEIMEILNSSLIEDFRFKIRKVIFFKFFDFLNKTQDKDHKNLILDKLLRRVKMKMTEKEINLINIELLEKVKICKFLQAKLILILISSHINSLKNDNLETLEKIKEISKKLILTNPQQIKKEFQKYITIFYFNKPLRFYEKFITKFENMTKFENLDLEIFFAFFISLQNKGNSLIERYMIFAEKILKGDFEENIKKSLKSILANYTFWNSSKDIIMLEGFDGDYERIKEITNVTKTEFNYFA